MRHRAAIPPSSLPSLMMPCPVCVGRMLYTSKRPSSSELEDTVYTCGKCGGELIRTSIRQAPRAGRVKSAEAA